MRSAGGSERERRGDAVTLKLDPAIPDGEMSDKWHNWLDSHRLVGPRNRNEYKVIVVGTGLAGASAASTLAGMGYRVECFCYQDSARRAHSIAAQGGINATKDYANEGDSVHRLFVDTLKGGDFRARRRTCGASPSSRPGSSTRRSLRASRSTASTAACSRPAASAASWSSARSTAGARPASSSCSAPTRRCRSRSTTARRRCTPATRCSTW